MIVVLIHTLSRTHRTCIEQGNYQFILYASATIDEFTSYIGTHRNHSSDDHYYITFEQNILFYTEVNIALLDMCAKETSAPKIDRLLVEFDAILRAGDAAGIQRAMGSR